MRNARILLSVLIWSACAAPAPAQDAVSGSWRGKIDHPELGEVTFELLLQLGPENRVAGGLRSAPMTAPLEGSWTPTEKELALTCGVRGRTIEMRLRVDGEQLSGTASQGGNAARVAAGRAVAEAVELPREFVALEVGSDRPETVDREGLAEDLAEAAAALIRSQMDRRGIVGLSAAFVVGGEVADVRSFGWENFEEQVPATAATMYRWASISKPLTAVAAMQLVESGALDLDRDVREYVPEFPEKPHVITSRQLLCHQGGIVHYTNGPVIRTEREYDVEHPFAHRVLALDMFKESPLVGEPEVSFSYSTPGYAILGAVVERAGGARYRTQVEKRILEPLAMTTMQPDEHWIEVPHRTQGYIVSARRRTYNSGDSDVCWKLAAGGWHSTVTDLARFAAGLTKGTLVSAETFEDMTMAKKTRDGEPTTYGFGFNVGEVAGLRTISHSGGQRKTSTFMLVAPERGLAVCLMCNTEGNSLRALAQRLLQILAG